MRRTATSHTHTHTHTHRRPCVNRAVHIPPSFIRQSSPSLFQSQLPFLLWLIFQLNVFVHIRRRLTFLTAGVCNKIVTNENFTGLHKERHPVPLSRNLGTLNSWNTLGSSRPVTGLFYLYRLHQEHRSQLWNCFDILLTVHLKTFISVFNQLDAQNLFHNVFYFMPLHVSSTCAHHQDVTPIGVMIPEAV